MGEESLMNFICFISLYFTSLYSTPLYFSVFQCISVFDIKSERGVGADR